MDDTAQPLAAAETEPVSREETILDAAAAFKVALGQKEPPALPERAANGQFTSPNPAPETAIDGEEEIEGEDAPEAGADAPESQEEGEDESEAPEEGQRKDPSMPESWPADKAEVWHKLDTDAQDFIRQRDAELKASTNAKFMEAANVRNAAQQIAAQAQADRERALQATEIALMGLRPQEPPLSMLDVNSSDYDPDRYHLAKAQHDQSLAYLNNLAAQRDQLRAQEQQEVQRQEWDRLQAINAAAAPAFVRDVPDLTDQAKASAVIQGLMDYAVGLGAPQDIFNTPTSALEWHVLWKAREYDKQQAAQAKVKSGPQPEPRKPSPPVRPGVATPPSARAAARRQQNLDRLSRSGSIADGAAVFKDFLKGK